MALRSELRPRTSGFSTVVGLGSIAQKAQRKKRRNEDEYVRNMWLF